MEGPGFEAATEGFLAGWQAELAEAGLREADLPGWLAQLVAALLAGQQPGQARAWLARIGPELARLTGRLPFAVVHDWHAETVLPLLAAAGLEQAGTAWRDLHVRARANDLATVPEWTAVLEPALGEVYRRAYGYAEAYAVNYANAHEYGTANGFGEQGSREYASYYAELATGANLRAYAAANAIANSHALAEAFAAGDPDRYGQSFPYATVRGYALALAYPDESNQPEARYARLADGLAASLAAAE